jgi:hypothetical protein
LVHWNRFLPEEFNLLNLVMKRVLILFSSLTILGSWTNPVRAQGCVAIKSSGGVCTMLDHPDSANNHGGWIFSTNARYFESYKHFVGREEQKQRIEMGTNVINHAFTQDLILTRVFNRRWSLSVDLPVLYNTRSSLYEHGGRERHETSSFGFGDIRLSGYVWLLDPNKHSKSNLQLGLGIKFSNGDYRYTDYFYTTTSGVRNLGPVDQSIQLGDGGTGIPFEMNGFVHLSSKLNVYGNFYYLINPREQNGVSTARGGTPSAASIANGSEVMSVPDQLMVRLGASYAVKKFLFSAGLRDEALPAKDLTGGSNGFRRPGYIISAEPGIVYAFSKFTLNAFVPVALIRCRTQSVPDKIRTDLTGTYTQGDAAFADYAINLGLSFRL